MGMDNEKTQEDEISAVLWKWICEDPTKYEEALKDPAFVPKDNPGESGILEVARALEEISVRSASIASFLWARTGGNHETAVKAFNETAVKIRKALFFTYPSIGTTKF